MIGKRARSIIRCASWWRSECLRSPATPTIPPALSEDPIHKLLLERDPIERRALALAGLKFPAAFSVAPADRPAANSDNDTLVPDQRLRNPPYPQWTHLSLSLPLTLKRSILRGDLGLVPQTTAFLALTIALLLFVLVAKTLRMLSRSLLSRSLEWLDLCPARLET